MIKLYICSFIFFSFLSATGTWMINGRTHPELKWRTITTENFDIHYHQGIYDIAMQGASIAEQIRPTLMKQMDLKTLKKLDIVFTSEDEILNGFALPSNNTIIWIDQNDAALWSGDEKWLRSVVAHELQHLVYFNTVKTWLPEPMNSLYSNSPSWIVEGMAEYYTEKWRPFRFDISHKKYTIQNKLDKIKDPHNDGFSKSLYLADRFGDSTITKIFNHRNKIKLFNFSSAFKKHTGITLQQFNKQWRRHISTYYYGLRAQKERVQDIGDINQLPLHNVLAFDYFPDSMSLAIIGRLDQNQRDYSLVIASRDTIAEKKVQQNKKNGKRFIKKKWKISELDYGIFGQISISLDVSSDGKSIVYTKLNRNKNQSIVFDIWKLDIESKIKKQLTKDMRANHPSFSPDDKDIVFIAHQNSTTQIYVMELDSRNINAVSKNNGDTQVLNPKWSYDKNFLAYSQSDPDGYLDIHIHNLNSGNVEQVTKTPEADYNPIWHPNSESLSFTGFYNYTPNLYTFNRRTKQIIQNTDVGDIIIGHKWNKKKSTVSAFTLDVDGLSTIVDIKPNRKPEVKEIKMNPAYSSWIRKSPDFSIKRIDENKPTNVTLESNYKFYRHFNHLGTFLLPDIGSFIYESAYSDVLGRHLVNFAYLTDYDSTNAILFQYQNSTGIPFRGFWGLNYFKDINFQFQIYNRRKSPLIEVFDGVSFWFEFPYNFGQFISSSHLFTTALQFWDRKVFLSNDYKGDIFENPLGGKEGTFILSYRFVKKRQNKINAYVPYQGKGLRVSTKFINESIWGERNYFKLETDTYVNKKIGLLALYFRLRYEQISGQYPPQEQLGLVDIPNYYFAGRYVPGREYMSLRGWRNSRLGNNAFIGTTEIRFPILPLNILELLSTLKLGQPTFAIISDFGNAWNNNTYSNPIIFTSGIEARFSILFSDFPILTLSYGLAQETENWVHTFKDVFELNEKKTSLPEPYFRLVLINPF